MIDLTIIMQVFEELFTFTGSDRVHVEVAVLYVLGQFRGTGVPQHDVAILERVQVEKCPTLTVSHAEVLRQAERIGAGGIAPPEDAFQAVRAATDQMGLSLPRVMTLAKAIISLFSSTADESAAVAQAVLEEAGVEPAIFADAQQRHREYPTTFEVPNAEELANIRRGTHVKLSLLDIERMWFVVLARSDDRMIVALRNKPVLIPEARFGDLFACETRHVLNVGPMEDPHAKVSDFEKEHADLVARQKNLAALRHESQERSDDFVNGKLTRPHKSDTGSLPN